MVEKNILFFILLIALFVRTASLFVFMFKNNLTFSESGMAAYPPNDDSFIYYHSARNLVEGKGYSITVTDPKKISLLPEAFKLSRFPDTYYNNYYPPMYSLFLAILYHFFGISILVYAIPQIILGTFSCYLVYIIAKKILSSKIGLLACFLLAIYPPIVWWTSYIRNENLFIPLQLISILFLIKSVKNNLDKKNIILAGFFLAISFLCRNVILYLPIFIVFYFLIIFFRKNKKRLFSGIAIFLLSFYIPLLLWGYRNYSVYDKFTVTTVEDWDAFYVCNNVPSADVPFFGLYEIYWDGLDLSMPITKIEKKKACITFVTKHPLKYLKLCLKRFIAYWGPITKKPCYIKKVVDTFIYIIVFPMTFWGFYKSRCWLNIGAGSESALTLLVTIMLYYTIIHSLVCVDDALIYRYPIIPLICIFSAYGYYMYFKRT